MDEDAPHQMRWPRVAARVGGSMILAAVLYVLSIGPAFYVFGERSLPVEKALWSIYGPILLPDEPAAIHNLLGGYVVWWWHLPGGPNERLLRKSTPIPASEEVN